MRQLFKTSQFIRGAAFAMALLTFLSSYLPFSVLDLTALVNQILMRWNAIAAQLGAAIATLIGFPSIPPEIINAVIIGASLGPVWSYTILRSEWGTHQGFLQIAAFSTRVVFGCLDGFLFALIAILFGPGLLSYFAIGMLVMLSIVVLTRMSALRKGFFFVLGALSAVEVIYFFSAPEVQSAFDAFVCGGESHAPRCLSTSP
ncbi:hypothetical protein [Palleronia salina]|uniref:hypothetical protein n=1 Tax=Palleronia salina TaxID=313368 RepID=UPI001114C4B0|nr:hypothetical protein [Palleronia salina]